jgi:hypothetical protein
MLFDFLLFGLIPFLAIPLITAYFAHSRGRSFWLWALIGTLLPILSNFILLLLPDKRTTLDHQLHQLRVSNGLLGLKPETSLGKQELNRLLKRPSNLLSFTTDSQRSIQIMVDGKPLLHHLRMAEYKRQQRNIMARFRKEKSSDILAELKPVPRKVLQFPSRHLCGDPHLFYTGAKGKAALYVCAETGSAEQQAIFVQVEFLRKHVIWNHFVHAPSGKMYKHIGPFVFRRFDYELALRKLSQEVC